MNPQMTTVEADKILKSINVSQIISDKENDIKEAQIQNLSNERASREPIPNIIEDAFNSDEMIIETSVGEVKIRKMVIADMTIFKLTDSPFYKLMMGDVTEDGNNSNEVFKKLFPDEEYLSSLVYQFTNPVKDVYKLIKKSKSEYYDTVTEYVGFVYEPADILLIVNGIIKHIGMVNQAHVEFDTSISSEDKKKLNHS